ncbi:MAG: SUMF1/EgtB/PvdO family nonheme iron enzyme [Lentisphaerae bacterium]|nr:SUMF1/EgtB/PvdO family nonheme iron enzyme [Lentisphaerota bacterium]
MRSARMIKMALCLAVTGAALRAQAVEPAISGVTVRQCWPWSRHVNIDYVLECDEEVDVAVSAFNGPTPLPLPLHSLSGDIFTVAAGTRRIVWDPTVTAYTNTQMLTKFRVELTPAPVPLYLIIDLTDLREGVPAPVEHVYETDLVTNKWGSWERDPVTNRGVAVESVIWTGVTNGTVYKTDKLVMRRVRAGDFKKGDSLVLTDMDQEYYISVFELTAAQWDRIMGGTSSSMLPKAVSYNNARGAVDDDPPVDWPDTGTYVSPGSFVERFRALTGIPWADLPTGDQFEYAQRAGTDTVYHDGTANVYYNTTGTLHEDNNGYTNQFLKPLGWYLYDDGTLHPVGEKRANAWGLYDTQGNMQEWCINWYKTGTNRRKASGKYNLAASHARSGCFLGGTPSSSSGLGLRLIINLPSE